MNSLRSPVRKLAAVAMLGSGGSRAAEAPAAFKIATIFGRSGPLAVIGADMRRGVEIALEGCLTAGWSTR